MGKRHSSTRRERRGVSFVQAKPFCFRLWCDELESMSFKEARAATARCCTQQQSAQRLMPRGSIRFQTIQMFPSSAPGQLLHSCLQSGFVSSCARAALGKRSLVARLQVLIFWHRNKMFFCSPTSLSRRVKVFKYYFKLVDTACATAVVAFSIVWTLQTEALKD